MKAAGPKAVVAVVGIGNPVVGDDGAGIEVIERLRARWSPDPRVLLLTLEGDLFEISDHLERARRFVFADALAGSEPGQILRCERAPRAYAPSFHQVDVGSVMAGLEALGMADPFPAWEVWGVTVDPPREVRVGLTPAVAAAVGRLTERLSALVEEALSDASPTRGG